MSPHGKSRLHRAAGLLAVLVGLPAVPAHAQSFESIIHDTSARPASWFAQSCVPVSDAYVDGPDIRRSCSVNEFGFLADVDGAPLYFALYRRLVTFGAEPPPLPDLDKAPFRNTGVVIFQAEGPGPVVRPFLAHVNEGSLGTSWFERPRVIVTAHGPLLMIPDRLGGTAAANEDIYYRWARRQWQRLETLAWLEDLAKRLPKGFVVWKGIVLDLEGMKAESAVWRDGDANCCPTGGWVCIGLAYRGNAVGLDTVRHDPNGAAGMCSP